MRFGLPLVVLAAGGAALAARRARPRFDFSGRTALVTGGSRGLGLAIARRLAREGARLVLVARDADELARAAAELSSRGALVHTMVCDVRDRAQAARAVEAAVERFGRLDVLVNNAGVIQAGPLEQMTFDDFENAMATHFRGSLHMALAALPHLRRQPSSRIVNIASIGGRMAVPHLAPYCASKFALVGLSDALGVELAPSGVRVTTVSPGLMRTGSHVNALMKGQHEREFAWFAAGASLPLVAVSAERAAGRIIEACRRATRR